MPGPTIPTANPGTTPPPYPTRFGWGMRLFLGLLLFDIIFRSFSIMIPWKDWANELGMAIRPRRLPTRDEMAEMRAKADPDDPDPVAEEVMQSADSLWEFFKPWPEREARPNIRTWSARGKWVLTWTTSRLEIVENILGFNEEWPMFSPNVGRQRFVTRARLVYDDGTERTVRNSGDPEDLCHYSHWFIEKVSDHELKVQEGFAYAEESFGYCNLLRHRYPTSDSGSALKEIHLFAVRYDLPPPGVDARQWLRDQTGPPRDQVYPDFYLFDARANHGKCLLDKYP